MTSERMDPDLNLAEPRFMPHSFDLLADQALTRIWRGYDTFMSTFAAITQRAAERFEQRDWKGMHTDTVARLDLYQQVVADTYRRTMTGLGLQAQNPRLWMAIKSRFATSLAARPDAELACTFYNSINRRILQTVGIDPELEFIAPEPSPDACPVHPGLIFRLELDQVTDESIQGMLRRFKFRTPFADIKVDSRLCAERIRLMLAKKRAGGFLRIEMISMPFFRDTGAYLIGRLSWHEQFVPLVFALANSDRGIQVDALLLRTSEIRVLFSFSHTYFHVRTECPSALVRFLNLLMPSKRTAELYIGLGYHKHGKTELYRELLAHQRVCTLDRFAFAAGQRGMVMIVFNMPQDQLVYKLIRDRFATPKHATARQVMEKYDYVFRHDRAGRLVDVQTFENLEIEDCCFSPELLAEIQNEARHSSSIVGQRVILHHVYVERRMVPMDVYLQRADADAAKAAVIDYGRAIKDLARINIFPGDLLIKNFGVTQLGRVVFYDYDELCPLTQCNFRWLPQARGYEDEMSAEPWFMVEENDVFPEEFLSFLALSPDLRAIFLKHHGDLLTPTFWLEMQTQIRSGVITPILPYDDAQRLRPGQPYHH